STRRCRPRRGSGSGSGWREMEEGPWMEPQAGPEPAAPPGAAEAPVYSEPPAPGAPACSGRPAGPVLPAAARVALYVVAWLAAVLCCQIAVGIAYVVAVLAANHW